MSGSGRDESIERLLRQSLKTPQSAADAGPACLDAETLAAWMDGGLKGAALESAQAHAADCARCRALVAAMVRTGAAGVVAPAAAEHTPFISRWLAWAVPLTAAAAAVVIWAVVPGQRVPAPGTPAVDQRQAAVEQAPAAAPLAGSPAAPPPAPPAPAELAAPPAAAATDELRDAAASTRQEQARDQAQAPLTASRETTPPQAAQSGSAASPPVQAAAAPSEPAGALRNRATALAESAGKAVGASAMIITTPDPAIQWRLQGSTVERSTDGGSSWEAAFTGTEALTAASAPSASVCWVVGQGGTVLLSTEGGRFTRLAFPEPTDLQSVQAADARSATVATAAGREYATADGGETWRAR